VGEFLLVPAYPGSPGPKAVKQLLLLLFWLVLEKSILQPFRLFEYAWTEVR